MEEEFIALEQLTETALELLMTYGPKLILAFLVLIFGLWFIKGILKVMDAAMDRAKVEPTLQKFLMSFTSVGFKVILLVIFASMIGVETASLIAMLGAAGLAVGLALQGSLSNFAGGVLILLFKPFKVGDVVEAEGNVGVVREIQIFNTVVMTLDNKKVVIPNAILSNGVVKNLSSEPTRRVDITFGISYDDDIQKAKQVLKNVISSKQEILSIPAPEVYVSAHADSSINILTRSWVNNEDYWQVYFYLMEEVKLAFDREGISIPFPQRDVHMK